MIGVLFFFLWNFQIPYKANWTTPKGQVVYSMTIQKSIDSSKWTTVKIVYPNKSGSYLYTVPGKTYWYRVKINTTKTKYYFTNTVYVNQ